MWSTEFVQFMKSIVHKVDQVLAYSDSIIEQ